MQADIFRDILVPVIGGLGIFMLGLEFMSNGIQSLAVNRMRAFLAKVAGTPITGLFAGTLITGIIQSSTAMTVMVVGLVNAGVMGLRPAIAVIMGANIGTTLGNGLIALPLGPLGLILAGLFALVYVFGKSDRTRNIALTCVGFSLIFYGLNLMIGGLRPLRAMPEVMSALSTLQADDITGVISCVLVAALITALIHSSSATIGIVMGLGAAGVLDWQTVLAFSLGADLGTTITSWIASLNLTKNAKRAAYAHISFNVIGVAVMLPLFFPSVALLQWAMQWFGGDPGVAVMVYGRETYPLVPVAVGLYSTVFNIFNAALMFPFVEVFYRVLSRIGHTQLDDREDYSQAKFLDPQLLGDLSRGVPAVQQELGRYLDGAALFLDIARRNPDAPASTSHAQALETLGRDIRQYTARLSDTRLPYEQASLVASLIEEEDWIAGLGAILHQAAHRIEQQSFSPRGRELVNATLDIIAEALRTRPPAEPGRHALAALRERGLNLGPELPWTERAPLLTLLGSAGRALYTIERIDTARRSASRSVRDAGLAPGDRALEGPGQAEPVPT